MKKLIGRLFARPAAGESAQPAPPPLALHLAPGVEFPAPDWQRVEAGLPAGLPRGAARSAAARQWLAAFPGGPKAVIEAEHFLALAGQAPRIARAALAYADKTRARILRLLEGIASDRDLGKPCIIVFDDDEAYARYVMQHEPEADPYGLGSARYLHAGHPHFALTAGGMAALEQAVAQVLPRLYLTHLELPDWTREGLAAGIARLLAPRAGCGRQLPQDLAPLHQRAWRGGAIQDFWSGRALHQGGEAAVLALDLAERLVHRLGEDRAAFVGFANAALAADGGAAAAHAHFGTELSDLAAAVLGEGDWQPRPESWHTRRGLRDIGIVAR